MVFGLLKTGTVANADAANALIMRDFGLTRNTLVDYKATADTVLGSHARFIATELKGIPVSSEFVAGLSSTYAILKVKTAIPGVTRALENSIQPFVYQSDPVLQALRDVLPTKNSSNIVVRSVLHPSDSDNAFLETVAQTYSSQHAADYGFIDYHSIDEPTLRNLLASFAARNIGGSDPVIQAKIDRLRADRTAAQQKASLTLSPTVDDFGYFGQFTKNPSATLDYALDVAGAIVNAEVDGIDFWTKGTFSRVTAAYKGTKRTKALIMDMRRTLGLLGPSVAAAKCGKSIDDYSAADGAGTTTADVVTACIEVGAGAIADLSLIKKHGSISAAIKAGNAMQVFTFSYLNIESEPKRWELYKLGYEVWDIVKELSSFSTNSYLASKFASVDMIRDCPLAPSPTRKAVAFASDS